MANSETNTVYMELYGDCAILAVSFGLSSQWRNTHALRQHKPPELQYASDPGVHDRKDER
jgi:hypothetical protein